VGQKVFESKTNSVMGNIPLQMPISISIPENERVSQPYWLEKSIDGAIYQVTDRRDIGKPFNDMKFGGTLSFNLAGQSFEVSLPLMYKYNDQVDGEIKQPFTIVPEIDLTLSKETVFLIPDSDPKLKVTVHFKNQFIDGGLDFVNLPGDQYKILSITDNAFLKERVYEVEFMPNGNGLKEVTAPNPIQAYSKPDLLSACYHSIDSGGMESVRC
jgi:hypothetical protein